MPDPRVHLDAALRPGAQLKLDEAQSRRLGTVLRLGPGAGVRVFNAADGEWQASIAAKDKAGLTLAVGAQLRAARSGPDLTLLFAPVKRDATDLIAEKATELGAARLRPVITARTIAETVRTERLALIAKSAAEQTERFDVPEILPPLPLAKALDSWDERPLLYADESGEVWGGEQPAPLPEAAVLKQRGGALALLTGPEGGFTPEERRMLRGLNFVTPVSLGPRILRAETAVIAALSVIQAVWGDWRPRS